jgi:hypothetical protein
MKPKSMCNCIWQWKTLIRGEIHRYGLVTAKHRHVLENTAGGLAGDARDLEAVPMQAQLRLLLEYFFHHGRDDFVALFGVFVHRSSPVRVLGGSPTAVSAMDLPYCQTFPASPAMPGVSF